MKPNYLSPLILAAVVIAGCKSTDSSGKSSSAATSATATHEVAGGFNTTQFVDAFKNADTETTRMVQSVVSSLGNKDWSGALSQLQKIQKIPGLTATQADSVKSLIGQLQTKSK